MHSQYQEHDDLIGIQRGDHAALKRAWQRHADFVFFIAGKYLANRESQEDIVQDVFIKLANSAKTISDSKSLRGWLAITTRNACIDLVRRNRRNITVDPETIAEMNTDPQSAASNFSTPDDLIAIAEREAELALVGSVLDQIADEPGGETLIQFYRDGVPVAEIARRRGESVSTVTSRLTRLRAKLRTRFLAQIEDGEQTDD